MCYRNENVDASIALALPVTKERSFRWKLLCCLFWRSF